MLPWWVHSYVAGGCGDENTQRANVQRVLSLRDRSADLNGAYERDLSVSLFGMTLPTPLFMGTGRCSRLVFAGFPRRHPGGQGVRGNGRTHGGFDAPPRPHGRGRPARRQHPRPVPAVHPQ